MGPRSTRFIVRGIAYDFAPELFAMIAAGTK